MIRLTVTLVLLVAGSQAFVPNSAKSAKSSVVTSMAADAIANTLGQFDPAVVGGIAASILGLGGVAVKNAGGDKSTAAATKSPKPSSGADVSIPYDAAARLAYDEYRASGKEADFEAFKTKYEVMTVASITAKTIEREMFPPTATKVDVSIPYDAAAKLAYDEWRAANGKGEWGNESEFEEFKAKYDEMCVAMVTAKKLQREMA